MTEDQTTGGDSFDDAAEPLADEEAFDAELLVKRIRKSSGETDFISYGEAAETLRGRRVETEDDEFRYQFTL